MAEKCYGRSLAELIYVISIFSIITTIGLPNLLEVRERNTRTQTINQMTSALQYARSNAVFNRTIVSICSGVSSCSGSKNWQNAILIFIDRNADGQLSNDDELLLQANITDEFSWNWNRTKGHIQFEPDGTTRALNGTLTLCRKGTPEHQIVIALAGRTRSQRPAREAKC
jgi:type IV fimbrial biogenesis protein FimT